MLLTQAFAAQHDDRRSGGRVLLFTSGQHLAPMSQELPYAISKGAIHQMTLSLADALADRGIAVHQHGDRDHRPVAPQARQPADHHDDPWGGLSHHGYRRLSRVERPAGRASVTG